MNKFILLIVLSLGVLSGCGGGSSNNASGVVTPPDNSTPTPTPTSLTVTAVDGYLENAIIFIDLNENYQLDNDEPNAISDAQGQVTFDLTTLADALTKPIIVQAIAGQTIDHSSNTTVRHHYSMIAPPLSNVVSPLTTLAQFSFTSQQQLDLNATIASLETQLGLPAGSNLMADYLSDENPSEHLHAIARAIVPLLPQDLSSLFNSSDSPLLAHANTIAAAINNAINSGAEPLNLFTQLNLDGSASVNQLTINHAEDFVTDVQLWSDEITGGFLQAAGQFAQQIDAASEVIKDDTIELLKLTLDYAKAGLLAAAIDNYGSINAGLVVSGSTGTITLSADSQSAMETIQIDAVFEDKIISATIIIPNNGLLSATMTGELASDKVTINIHQGSSLTLDNSSLLPTDLSLNATVTTKPTDNSSDIVTFNGIMALSNTLLVNSTGLTFVIPTSINFSGEFDINNSEFFYATIVYSAVATMFEDTLHLDDFSVKVGLNAQFSTVDGAQLIFDLNQVDLGSALTLTIIYGDKSLTIDIYFDNDQQMIVISNNQGIVLTINLALQLNKDNLGQLTLGAHNVATVSKNNGKYQLTFDNGQTIELF